MPMTRLPRHATLRGLALPDAAAGLAATTILLAAVLPALGGLRGLGMTDRSLANLAELGVAHAIYAAEWNGRQLTYVDDELSTYGTGLTTAFLNYEQANDVPHPAHTLGWGLLDEGGPPVLFAYRTSSNSANQALHLPISFGGTVTYFGSWRLWNSRQFHQYVSGRVYDERLFAPPHERPREIAAPLLDEPWEFVRTPPVGALGDIPVWSSYAMSPAAMFEPAVMRSVADGGWQNPFGLADGFRSPSLWSARHPSLKTFMLEHHWLQDRPVEAGPCNPAFKPGSYDNCEPWYFNHSIASKPATLFYDLSTRLLPVAEAVASDEQQVDQTGVGLWSRDTTFGANGYFSNAGYDATQTSFHVLTTDGILGRDVIDGLPPLAAGGSPRGRGVRTMIDARPVVELGLPKGQRFDSGGAP